MGGRNSTDYTFAQLLWDDQPVARFNNTFYQPQYAALSVFSTVAYSNYNAAQFSIRQRLSHDIQFDFNYTFSHSLDNASGLQNSTALQLGGIHSQCARSTVELCQFGFRRAPHRQRQLAGRSAHRTSQDVLVAT